MGELNARRTSWSVTLRAKDPAELEQAFEGFVEATRATLGERFPDNRGYETRQLALSGPIEGVRFEIHRGRFRGSVSAQRYRRSQGSPSRGGLPLEVRLVANPDIAPHPDSVRASKGPSMWGVAGCALGTITLGTLGLGVAGLVSTWGQALVLIPALVAWRTCTAISLANTMTPRAIEGQVRAHDAQLADATTRWNRALESLVAFRDVLDQQGGAAPFRSPGGVTRPLSAAS